MKIKTTRFGEVEVDDTKVITMLGGIIGFENYYRFVILDFLKDSQFKWLQSLNEPGLAFVVCDPWFFFKDYNFEISDEDQNELEIENVNDIMALAIATIPTDITKTTLNLVSPLIVNMKKMIAKQIVLYDSSYRIKHNIILKVEIKDKNEIEEIKIRLQDRLKEKIAAV